MCRWSTALYTCGHRSPPVRVEEETCEDSTNCTYDGSDAIFKVSYKCRLCDPWDGPPSQHPPAPARAPAPATGQAPAAATAAKSTTTTRTKSRPVANALSPRRPSKRRRRIGKAIKGGFKKTAICICQRK
ncbi:hypothetical protein ACJ73_05125 [Blastomyces percursus]|uniref:Uncharacterized protein n=1 Tax=Blastomyces percursus TaxID=1658174 RepID=A0A1J9R4T9_9EURO|nr:hypothetical protein ACJ73_05125 [Blastomyces percursus]